MVPLNTLLTFLVMMHYGHQHDTALPACRLWTAQGVKMVHVVSQIRFYLGCIRDHCKRVREGGTAFLATTNTTRDVLARSSGPGGDLFVSPRIIRDLFG